MDRAPAVLLITSVALLASTVEAYAYIGPGAGLSAIGTVVALFAALAFGIVGFVWYPMKRWRSRLRERRAAKKDAGQP